MVALFVLFNRDTGTHPLYLSLGASAMILLLLDFWQGSLAKPAARVLADVALLTPAIPLLVGY